MATDNGTLTITHPQQGQTVKQGMVTITGGGPSGKKVHLILRSVGQIFGEWTVPVSGGQWSVPEVYLRPGPYAITAYLLGDTRPGTPSPDSKIALPPDLIRDFSVGP